MNQPPIWESNDLDLWRLQSIDLFRKSRLEEPLEYYGAAFDNYRTAVENLLEQTVDLSQLREQAAGLLQNKKTLELIRYLAGPLISQDDLNTLLGVTSISVTRIKEDSDFASQVVDLVINTLDQRRFPWVRDGREPDEAEKLAAVIASATLLANRKVATERRHEGKEIQESAVIERLKVMGWSQVDPKKFNDIDDAPKPGQFCRETTVHGNKADIVIRLLDRRLMLIECKVSNSQINSIKRLNEAKKKATEWRKDLGDSTVVAAAVLSGVFSLKHLEQTQARGLALFWAHDLDPLAGWIENAKLATPNPSARKANRK